MVNHDDTPDYEAMAAGLDRWQQVPTDVLTTVVMRRGLCLWGLWPAQEPDWDDCAPSDRELAARLCAGCPVIDQCREMDLRLAGACTTGVWGALKTTGAHCTECGNDAASTSTHQTRKED